MTGVGAGALPIYFEMSRQSYNQRKALAAEFQTQRDLVYLIKMRELKWQLML
jgi:hypothetical protein